MSTKYVARYEGKIVGKRKSENRTYTHAVIGMTDIEAARRFAYYYTATDSDRSNYRSLEKQAVCEGQFFQAVPSWETQTIVGQTRHGEKSRQGAFVLGRTKDEVEEAKVIVAGGFDGYIARRRAEEIKRFKKRISEGGFAMHALTWCGRPDLAQKQISKYASQTYSPYTNLQIVPAEAVK